MKKRILSAVFSEDRSDDESRCILKNNTLINYLQSYKSIPLIPKK